MVRSLPYPFKDLTLTVDPVLLVLSNHASPISRPPMLSCMPRIRKTGERVLESTVRCRSEVGWWVAILWCHLITTPDRAARICLRPQHSRVLIWGLPWPQMRDSSYYHSMYSCVQLYLPLPFSPPRPSCSHSVPPSKVRYAPCNVLSFIP